MYSHLDLDAANTPVSQLKASAAATRKTLNALSLAVAKSKRVVVVTGAGISCSSGIPDFRSSDGLYNLVKSRYPNVVLKGRDLFSASLFREPESTRLFYAFIAELKAKIDLALPGPTHRFIKTLDAKGKLLRSYTQNIDGFEEKAGIQGAVALKGKTKKFNAKDTKNVQLHGDIHGVRCVMCSASYACSQSYLNAFLDGSPPDCPECSARSDARLARNARPLAVGTLRPAIVLYDEAHPLGEEIGAICSADMGKKPDVLVIMGTSLKVHGIKRLVKDFANAVHHVESKAKDDESNTPSSSSPIKAAPSTNLLAARNPKVVIFVNRTPPPADLAHVIDYWVEGDTDTWVQKCEADWRAARPQDWEVQTKLFAVGANGKQMPLGEEINTWQVVKGGEAAATGANKKGKQPLHSTKSPGSENALPSRMTMSFMNSQPRAVLPPWPSIHPSRSSQSLATHAASIPLPQSPKRRRGASISVQTKGLGSFGRHNVDVTDASDIEGRSKITAATSSLVQRSPKKKRRANADPMPLPPADSDDEDFGLSLPPANLFGTTRARGEDMSLDDIDVNDIMISSQATTIVGDADEAPRSIIVPRPPLRHQRGEFDMSLDDIQLRDDAAGHDTETEAEDGGSLLFSSQTTIVAGPSASAAPVRRRTKVNLIVKTPSSSQVTSEPEPKRLRTKPATTRAAARKAAPPGGVVKTKSKTGTKAKAAPKVSRMGSGSARNPIEV